MRVRPLGRSWGSVLGFVLGLAAVFSRPSAAFADAPDAGSARPPSAAAAEQAVSTQLELRIEFVLPISRYSGSALVTAADPRFVVGGKVVWVQRPEVIALHSQPAFAIHSPARLGIRGQERGATVCLLLTRNIRNEKQHWELRAVKPDAGCRGGG